MGKAEKQAELETGLNVKSQMIYDGHVVKLRVDEFTRPDSSTYKREIVLHNGAVVMLPIDTDGKIIMVRQWRRAAKEIMLELPAGTVEEGEDPLETAKRELQEEIGYATRKITELGGFFSAPGFCTEYLHLYLAEDLYESTLEADDTEVIDVVRYTLDECLAKIEDGSINDAKSVAGIMRYYYLKTK